MQGRLLVQTAVILAMASPAPGQSRTLGLALGVTSSRYVGDFGTGDDPFRHRLGVTAGLTAELPLSNALSLQANLLYAQKGGRGFASSYPDMRVGYVELPITLRLTAPIPGATQLFLEGGAAPALEIACGGLTGSDHTTGQPPPVPHIPLDCDQMRTDRTDIAALMGAGIRITVGTTILTVHGRRAWGLTNLAAGFIPLVMRNRTWTILLGVSRTSLRRRP